SRAPVFNLEIHRSHTYYVSEVGVLGHNAGCGGPKKVTIDKNKYPEAARSGATGRPLTVDRAGAAARRRESMRGTKPVKGMDRDESPPAVFKEGGAGSSVRPIPPGDNRGAGGSLGGQLRDVPDGCTVIIGTGG